MTFLEFRCRYFFDLKKKSIKHSAIRLSGNTGGNVNVSYLVCQYAGISMLNYYPQKIKSAHHHPFAHSDYYFISINNTNRGSV